LTATEAADGLVGQPKEVADRFRTVLLDGAKVRAATDASRDGRIAIDTEAGAVLRANTGIDAYPDVPGAHHEPGTEVRRRDRRTRCHVAPSRADMYGPA
jgi:hypothetical protein